MNNFGLFIKVLMSSLFNKKEVKRCVGCSERQVPGLQVLLNFNISFERESKLCWKFLKQPFRFCISCGRQTRGSGPRTYLYALTLSLIC